MTAPVASPAPPAPLDHPLDGWEASASPGLLERVAERYRDHAITFGPFVLVALIALVGRLQYAWWGYHYTFGSGDSYLVLTKAWYLRAGELEPSASIGPAANIFGSPPLIPMLLAGFSFVSTASVATAALIVGPILTIIALLALYAIAARAFDRTIALIGVSLVAILPRFSFDSTEPDKVAYVVSFAILALLLLYEGQRRAPMLLAAGVCMGLALFSHTTAYLFVPVFVLSHVVLSRGDWRRMASPWFIAGCVAAFAFFAAYVMLDNRYSSSPDAFTGASATAAPALDAPVAAGGTTAPPAVAPPTTSGGEADTFLPKVVEDYWRNLWDLAQGGFQDSAWDLYFDGIRGQLLDPVYFLAIAGFVLATIVMVVKRRFAIAPLVLWMLIVTLGFAIQSPAPSHGSRYPSYVTPVFVIMAVFALITAARWLVGRMGTQPAYAIALAAPFVAWSAFSYLTAPEQGNRRLYEGHRVIAESIADQELLSDDSQLFYLGWPSYTYYLLDGGVDEEHLQTFGWRVGFADQMARPEFVEARNIRYFLHDDLLDDYFRSSAQAKTLLGAWYVLTPVESFCTAASASGCAGNVTLYELTPRLAATP